MQQDRVVPGRMTSLDRGQQGARTVGVALRLGRVSNLPTVWTNALVGIALAGGQLWQAATLAVILALSLLYVGGMYLNDAFDREIDARERPSRPIPAGEAPANTVFAAGFAMILAGTVTALSAARLSDAGAVAGTVAAATALAGMILAYDWRHKGNPWSPLLMGACRVLAYVTAALAIAGAAPSAMLLAAAVALSYLIGLTYIAKQDSLGRLGSLWPLLFLAAPVAYGLWLLPTGGWALAALLAAFGTWTALALLLLWRRRPGDMPRAVVALIVGIALLDALFLAGSDELGGAALAIGCFACTLALQRWISGT
ncbi:MAG TPA: UbiA family prenyltransferase [Falsiroseomonas sp.]|jgi:4-hydroxybenzoate polyprenyltransferase|nr:UbiA family prenyltransferase [Falsiroseomonas sp.]